MEIEQPKESCERMCFYGVALILAGILGLCIHVALLPSGVSWQGSMSPTESTVIFPFMFLGLTFVAASALIDADDEN